MAKQFADVAPLRADQIKQAGDLIARAFHDYPFFTLVFPDTVERARCTHLLQTAIARHLQRFGLTFCVGEPLSSVALLFPSDGDVFSAERLAQSGHPRMVESMGEETWARWRATLDTVYDYGEQQLERAMTEPHWVLEAIAVEPTLQGAGLGSALLDAVHARTDADGRPVALLTHNPHTLPFYRRHGYGFVCEGTEPTRGLRHWGLRRDPRP